MFLSAVWTLILTAPIHCRGSIAEQVMECYISQNLMKKQNHLLLEWPEAEYILTKFSFLGELLLSYSFKVRRVTCHSQLSSSNVQVCVSSGNRLKSILHADVTVTLKHQKINKSIVKHDYDSRIKTTCMQACRLRCVMRCPNICVGILV